MSNKELEVETIDDVNLAPPAPEDISDDEDLEANVEKIRVRG